MTDYSPKPKMESVAITATPAATQAIKAAHDHAEAAEAERDRLAGRVAELEGELMEARNPAYQAWLGSSECRRLTIRLQQATTLIASQAEALRESAGNDDD